MRALFVLLGCLTLSACHTAPRGGGPEFSDPEAFLRSVYPGLRAFGPAGCEGLAEADADYVPATGDELVALLQDLAAREPDARAGLVIGLRAGAEYDLSGIRPVAEVLSGQSFVAVPDGLTLAALAGNEPPVIRYSFPENYLELLERNAYSGRNLLELGPGSRLRGVRVIGPDVTAWEADYEAVPRSRFNAVRALTGAAVEYCEISRFHYSGVAVYAPAVSVRGNDIFDVHAYPVLVGGDTGFAHVEGNRLHWSWHAIAGSGQQGQGYIFRHNLVIHNGGLGSAHAVDMHAWRQMMAAGGAVYPFVSIGGDRMDIIGNVFVNDAEGIARWMSQPHRTDRERERFEQHPYSVDVLIRGMPRDLALVQGNWFSSAVDDQTVRLVSQVGEPGRESRANLWVLANYYGPGADFIPIGAVTRARIHFINPPLEVPRDPDTRRWNTKRIAVMPQGKEWRPEIELSLPSGLDVRSVVFRLGDSEHRFSSQPGPGAVVFDLGAYEPGTHILTVLVEDTRGQLSRHDMPVTIVDENEPAGMGE